RLVLAAHFVECPKLVPLGPGDCRAAATAAADLARCLKSKISDSEPVRRGDLLHCSDRLTRMESSGYVRRNVTVQAILKHAAQVMPGRWGAKLT
ncbi:MAG: hypothetical protein AB7G15_13035, partial [Alphaproteobacteria bacterium]